MAPALIWFRRDLRLADNPAWQALIDEGHTPIPVYIHDEPDADWPLGEASAWWLHHSLISLQQSLRKHGSDLLIFQGNPESLLPGLLKQARTDRLAWNRCYEPAWTARDARIRQALERGGYHVSCHNAALLREPRELLKKDGTPYRVFTPFWKKLYSIGPGREVITTPEPAPAFDTGRFTDSLSVDSLKLLPAVNWDKAFYAHWQPGEDGAWKALRGFSRSTNCSTTRTVGTCPRIPGLHACRRTCTLVKSVRCKSGTDYPAWRQQQPPAATLPATESWLRQLAWREFSHHLLYHFPSTPLESMDRRFNAFPWKSNYRDELQRWQRGQTGIPLVDAGMRELWTTGYMHNRVRMIVASFLVKNLLIPWQEGARWFWNTLVDADLANNTMGWQWCAGCGADAAPFFRIFNPVLQGEKFDREGRYIRRWIPELARLENRHLHKPWTADPSVLAAAGIVPGKDYPEPVVDLQDSRRRALNAWDQVRQLQVNRVR